MADDYFTKLGKRSQPVRDLFKPPSAPDAPSAPSAPKAASAPKAVKVGELQGESLDDYNYMQDSVKRIGKKLAPKSVMGKSSSKR
jgi:hypothetical protein